MPPGRAESRDAARSAGGRPRVRAESWLYAARGVRDFGDGFVAILLPAYLLALGYDALAVGIISTASLLGSALLTIGIGMPPPTPKLAACCSKT